MEVVRPKSERKPPVLHLNDLALLVRLLNEAPAMRNFWLTSRNTRRLGKLHLGELSHDAKVRLAWFDWYEAHGQNATLTCRHFGISRSTFYRWKKRFDRYDLRSLEERSSRPRRVRPRTWLKEEILAVKRLRERYPRWGKAKLRVLLAREGLLLSVSKVGRILSHLKLTRQLLGRSGGHPLVSGRSSAPMRSVSRRATPSASRGTSWRSTRSICGLNRESSSNSSRPSMSSAAGRSPCSLTMPRRRQQAGHWSPCRSGCPSPCGPSRWTAARSS